MLLIFENRMFLKRNFIRTDNDACSQRAMVKSDQLNMHKIVDIQTGQMYD